MTKISQLTDIGSGLASGDEFLIRDVSDVGTPNKKLTANGFVNYVINQASGVGFSQIADGVGPLSRVRATSSGSTGAVVFETALSGSLAERARINSSGNLLVGTSSSIEVAGPGGQLQVADGLAIASLSTFSNSTNSSFFMLGKSRGNTVGTYTIVNNQDLLGEIRFAGSNGTHLNNFAASIQGMVDGPPTASGLPGRLLFSTTASGTAISTERMRISQNGESLFRTNANNNNATIAAYSDATSGFTSAIVDVNFAGYSPNNATAKFAQFRDTTIIRAEIRSNGGLANYQANDVNLSDRNAKKDISPAVDTWDCLKEWEIVNYRYKDQPDDAGLNLGVIAQQVAKSCPEVITIFQEAKEAAEDKPAQEERLGIKEQQMYWMAIKALQEAQVRIETLEARLTAAGID
jgi:hypothetical protein